MFNGKLIQASTNFGCFMTLGTGSGSSSHIPESFKVSINCQNLILFYNMISWDYGKMDSKNLIWNTFKVKSFRIWGYVICKQLYGLYKLQRRAQQRGCSQVFAKIPKPTTQILVIFHEYLYSAEHVSGFMYIISISLIDFLNKMLLLSWYRWVQVLKSKYFQIDGIPSYL